MGTGGDPLPALRQRRARADLEPQPPRLRPDHDGRELRRRGPRPLLRPGRRAARRRRQPPHAGRRRRDRDGGRRPAATRRRSRTRMHALFRAMPAADPAHYVRGQYEATAPSTASPPDSTTETFAALRLDIDNWRWSGVPFFIRTGQAPADHADRAAAGVPAPAAAGLPPRARPACPSRCQLVIRLDPTTGVRLLVEAQRGDADEPEPISMDMEFADEGGEGPTPYEVLLLAAMHGDAHALHPPGRRRGGLARHAAAARRAAAGPPVRAGLVGPAGGRPSSSPATGAGTSRGHRLGRRRDR